MATALLSYGPWYILRQMAETRRLKIEDQLADAMVTLSSAVKAGLSLPQSMAILAEQCPKPINPHLLARCLRLSDERDRPDADPVRTI